MIQNQVRSNMSRWLHRVGLLITSALSLLLLGIFLSQQLTAVPVKEIDQTSTGSVAVAQAAPPTKTPETAPTIAAAWFTNTLPLTPTLAPLQLTTSVTATLGVTLSTSPATSQPSTATLSTALLSEPIALVGSDGAILVGDTTTQPLPLGTVLTVNGRSADGTQLYVTTSDSESGWLESSQVMAFNLPALPVQAKHENLAATAPVTTPIANATDIDTTASTNATVAVTDTDATNSPTLTPGAVRRPTARVTLQSSRLNVRAGPGTGYAILGKAVYNQSFPALARNRDATWVQIESSEIKGGFGWVSSEFINLSKPIQELPVSDQTNTNAPKPSQAGNQEEQPRPTPTPQSTPAAATVATTAASGQPTGLSGKLVIQSQLGGAFYLYDLATGAGRTLTSGMDPTFSPDGRQIAFARGGGANGIYLINSDGSNERKIFGERSDLRSPKWSPDGKWIVFSRADGSYECRDVGNGGLCPSDAQLVAGVVGNLPPDQQKAVENQIVNQFDQVNKPNWMIARISTTGADYRDLPALNSALAPDWAQAGIVYQSSAGLQRTDDRPDAQTQRIYADYNIQDPDWQPGNSGRIVFQMKQGSHWEIFAVNADGQGVVALTRPATTLVKQLPSNVAPAWSPNGQHIVFLSNREQNGEAGQWRVWVMNADGSNQRPLPIALALTYTFAIEQMVDWGA